MSSSQDCRTNDLLVYSWGYINLCEGHVVCEFGKGIDVMKLAEELGAVEHGSSSAATHEPAS